MAKENKPASAYAKPHTMSGKTVRATVKEKSGAELMKEMNVGSGVSDRRTDPRYPA